MINNNNKLLRLVLSNVELSSFYEFNPSDCPTMEIALESGNPIIVTIAKIIQEVSDKQTKANYKETYNEIISFLNTNIL